MDKRQRKAIIDTLQKKGINTDNIVELDATKDYKQQNYPDNCLVLYEGGESAYGKRMMRYLTKKKIRYAIGIVYGTLNVSEMMWNFKTTFEYYDGNKTKNVFLSEPVCALKHEDNKHFPSGWKLMINGEEYTVMGDEIKLSAFRSF